MARFVPDRVLAIRIGAALAPVAVVAFVYWTNRSATGVPDGTITQITQSRNFEGQPSLSPDGSRIAFRCDLRGNSDVCVSDVDGRNIRNLTVESRDDESDPAFSPDGQTIAFRSGSRGIFTMPADGGPMTQLTNAGAQPAWMPDGKSVVYSVNTIPGAVFRQGVTEGYIVDVTLHTTRRLPLVVDFHDPSVSPNGVRIAYSGRPIPSTNRRGFGNVRTDIWTVDLDGRPAVRVTNDAAVESSPMWSANGRYLYYVSNRNGSSAIWRVAIDERTGQPGRLPELVPTPYSQPAHITRSADGRRLVWSDTQQIERVLRVEFDPDARTTRGAPVEIAAGAPDYEEAETSDDARPPQAPTSSSTSGFFDSTGFPGHWSPERTLFAGTSAGAVWIYSAATREHYQLRPGRSPIWLNDGRRLIFVSDGRLFIGEAVLKISRELLGLSDQVLGSPRLSPDNRRLYFTAEGVDANLWLMRID